MDSAKIKVAIIQPVIPEYRVPLFNYLSQFKDIDITCLYSQGNKFGAKNSSTYFDFKHEIVHAFYLPFRAGPVYQCIIKRIVKGNFDVIVCSQSINNISTVLLWYLRTIFNYKFIWWGIGFDPYRQNKPSDEPETIVGKLILKLKNYLWKRSDSLLVYSEEGKNYSVNIKIPSKKIFVLKNTIHVEKLSNEADSITKNMLIQHKKELGLTNKSFVFLFVGRLHKRKEVPFLIKAYSIIAHNLKDTKLIIVGDGEDLPHVKKLMSAFKLQNDVILLGAIYDKQKLAKLFLNCDVVTLPGQVGLTIIHSFIYGKPVITKNSNSYSPELEYLTHGINGIMVNDNQLESYAKAMKSMYLNSSLRNKLSDGALKTAQKTTMHNMAHNFRKGIIYTVQ